MNFQIVQILQNAIAAIQANEFIAAQSLLNEVLRIEKNQPDALRFLGVIAALQKDWDQALRLIDLAIECNPQNGVAHSNRGNILIELGRSEEALLAYENAINLQPSYAEAHSNRGNVLQALGRYQEALTSYEKAVQIDPNYAQAFYGVARLFLLRKQYDYAFGCCEQALKINPRYEEALALKGEILFEIKDYSKALTVYDELLLLNSNSCEAWISKGNIFSEIKQFQEAEISFRSALAIAPDTEFLLGLLIQNRLQMCKWEGLDKEVEDLARMVEAGKKAAIPYNLISLLDDRRLIRRSIEIYADSMRGSITRVQQVGFAQKEKIRLGYFSADFHDHPTAHLIAELFECHDKSKFELIAFVFGRNTTDAMRMRLEKSFDQFIDVNDRTDKEVAELSREMEIDIAIDLKGFTGEARPKIFMYGAAPIQISYLGFPGTMGSSSFDYVVADSVLIPEANQDGMAEKIIYMPDTYQVNDKKRPIAPLIKSRLDFGLPSSGFIFCCFNNNYKITPVVFDGWVRILDSVKDSVLWLYEDNPYAKENLKQEFRKRGLDANRLIFAGRMDLPNHLARYQLADLFLDTTPCNAHTTASDALWAGLPVLTVIGQSFGSRVAASLLKSVGLPELITNNQAEYERLAIELATKPTKIHEFKSRLKRNILHTPLFDTVKFTKNLEIAFQEVFRRKHANLAPDHIHVSQVNPR
ncbi:tetratricopeptide repeat protein [Polynucleobacter sp. MWH-Braz-FAM2G]|uniref:O-linked N-acetylglucosamine transferase, SPINDLY family protein n=1 Tax=Polynucleobacter sp. MWH-Braz-FAM2G TaxID=1855883 RepID=UPI001BFD885F|nr:tetratricopeptide repeat protein [Polynucleobacter sp. MWH-Braz-FAM2G]QWD90887.1 tetratricopeptide repeat protein [Polynucleobacter sp. MWH-Braz-FAM2G]